MRASLLGWDQVSGLLVPELHLVAEHVNVQQLPHVLFPIVLCGQRGGHQHVLSGYRGADCRRASPSARELSTCDGVAGSKLLPDLAQLLVHPGLLLLLVLAIPDVRDEDLHGERGLSIPTSR